jgi:hypothetical protein
MAAPAVGVSRIGLCGLAVMGQVRRAARAAAAGDVPPRRLRFFARRRRRNCDKSN